MFNRHKQQKQAEEAAAQAAADRFVNLSAADLAAEVFPVFGPDGPGKGTNSIGLIRICRYLMREIPRGDNHLQELLRPVRESLQVLEHAALIEIRTTHNGGVGLRARATRLGLTTIGDGSVAEKLAAPAQTA